MATLYLLDTNTVSYIIKGHPPRVRRHLLGIPAEQIAISVITEGVELRFWRRQETRGHKLQTGGRGVPTTGGDFAVGL